MPTRTKLSQEQGMSTSDTAPGLLSFYTVNPLPTGTTTIAITFYWNGQTVRHSLTHHQSESLHCVVYDCISTMTTPHPGHVRSVQVRPGQVRPVAYNTRRSQTDRGTGSAYTLDDVSVNSHINLSLLTLLLLFSPAQSPGQKSHNASSAIPRQKDVSRKTVRFTPFSLSPLPKSEIRLFAVVRQSF